MSYPLWCKCVYRVHVQTTSADYRTCWTISRTGLYRAKGQNRPFLMLEPYTPRTRYLPRNVKYCRDLAVANANGVLVRLICDGLGPG